MSREASYDRSKRARDTLGGILAAVTRMAELLRSVAGNRLTVGRWVALATVGLGLLIVSSLVNGTDGEIPWYAATVATAVAIVLVCRSRWGRQAAIWVLGTYAVALPIFTILAGFDLGSPWGDARRVSLFTANPNLLGADLVVVAAALLVTARRSWWLVWLPVVAMAVVLTGSRTSLVALLALAVSLSLVVSRGWPVRLGLLGLVVGFVGLFVAASIKATERAEGINLLRTSVTFADEAWRTGFARSVVVQSGVVEGPFPGTVADRIRATSDDRPLTIYQGVERSREGTPYVASVYLRAAEPQVVVLSTHLSRTRCQVTMMWSRCVTPAEEGNGRRAAQFRLEAEGVGGSYDVYAFGPQLERSRTASPYEEIHSSWLSRTRFERFRLDAIIVVEHTRLAAMKAGLDAFLSSPVFGVGKKGVGEALSKTEPSRGVRHLTHTHNLLTERLAAEGVVGVVGWLLVLSPAVIALPSHKRLQLLPLYVCLVVLNSADLTYFHVGSYSGFWAAVGMAWHNDESVPSTL